MSINVLLYIQMLKVNLSVHLLILLILLFLYKGCVTCLNKCSFKLQIE